MTVLDFLEIALRAIVTNTLQKRADHARHRHRRRLRDRDGRGRRRRARGGRQADQQPRHQGARRQPEARVYGGRSSAPGTNLPLSEDDLAAIETKVPGVVAISGQLWASTTVVRGNVNTWTRIWGVHEQYLAIRNWTVDSGRPITAEDNAAGRRVGLLGQSVVTRLFGDNDPVGQIIRVADMPFLVIGVLSAKGSSIVGDDLDDSILVPMTTARKHLIGWQNVGQVGQISVKFEDGADPRRTPRTRSSRCCARAGACRRATTTRSTSPT